jgi:Cytochrome c553
MRQSSIFVAVGVLMLAPVIAWASSSVRTDYAAAVRSKPNLERGAELFRTCAACHGPSGEGTLDGNVPRIAGQHSHVLAKQLVDYRHEKRWDIRMERIADRHFLKDMQAVADVAAFASELKPPYPPRRGKHEPDSPGSPLYAARCQSCHGPAGEGNADKLVPRLAGQHYEYLVRQIYDAVDGRRPNLSRKHIRLLAKLERDDILDVAEFLSRSAWSDPARLEGNDGL